MALPLIAVGVLARILLRGGIVAARKYAAKNGVRISANVLSKAKNVNKTKKITNLRGANKKPTITKTKPKVKMTNISAKNKNIAEKVEKTVRGRPIKPKKIKAKPSKTDLIKKVDKKSIATKTDKTVKTVKGKPVKPKVDKKTSVKTKTKVDKKVDKKSLATKSKTSKVKDTKKADKKVDKKSLATKNKTTKTKTKEKVVKTVKGKPVKTKPSGSNLPIIVGGGLGLAGMFAGLSKKNKKKAPNIPKGLTPPSILNPKPSTGTGRGEGSKETARRKEDAIGSAQKSPGPKIRKKLNTDRSGSYESRIRALVSKKDALTKIESGDGRSEYQVRINKLKKENPKEFKKLFKLGGFGNLKD